MESEFIYHVTTQKEWEQALSRVSRSFGRRVMSSATLHPSRASVCLDVLKDIEEDFYRESKSWKEVKKERIGR